jgi:hypothetical protein
MPRLAFWDAPIGIGDSEPIMNFHSLLVKRRKPRQYI